MLAAAPQLESLNPRFERFPISLSLAAFVPLRGDPGGLVTALEGCSAEEGTLQVLALLLQRWLSTAVGAEPMDSVQSQLSPAAVAAWGRFSVDLGHVREEEHFGQKQLSLHISAESVTMAGKLRRAIGSALPTGVGASFSPVQGRSCTSGSSTVPMPHHWRCSHRAPASKCEGFI